MNSAYLGPCPSLQTGTPQRKKLLKTWLRRYGSRENESSMFGSQLRRYRAELEGQDPGEYTTSRTNPQGQRKLTAKEKRAAREQERLQRWNG